MGYCRRRPGFLETLRRHCWPAVGVALLLRRGASRFPARAGRPDWHHRDAVYIRVPAHVRG